MDIKWRRRERDRSSEQEEQESDNISSRIFPRMRNVPFSPSLHSETILSSESNPFLRDVSPRCTCDERGVGLLVSLFIREHGRTEDVAAAFLEIPLLTMDEHDGDLGQVVGNVR
jgi:hypothetical protein